MPTVPKGCARVAHRWKLSQRTRVVPRADHRSVDAEQMVTGIGAVGQMLGWRPRLEGIGVHLHVFDAVPGAPNNLVETDLFGTGGGRIQSDRTGNEERRKKPFQWARGALNTSNATELGKTILLHWFRHSSWGAFSVSTILPGDAEIRAEDPKVDAKVKSICKGC
jgi:hypothetical protein